jgi:hypothetical protein
MPLSMGNNIQIFPNGNLAITNIQLMDAGKNIKFHIMRKALARFYKAIKYVNKTFMTILYFENMIT